VASPFGGCKNESFRVSVVTPDRKPVAGAHLYGGFDWDVFDDQTDAAGIAHIPNWADGWDATITKNNFYPADVKVSPGTRFTLTPTPESLTLIGEVKGSAIRFGPETLITVSFDGQYRVYTYDETRLTEHTSLQLPAPINEPFARSDTLWYSVYDSGLFAFSLSDPMNPSELMHLDIDGDVGSFLVLDTFVVVGNENTDEPLRIFRIQPEAELVATFGNYRVTDMSVISHYLVITGDKPNLPVVFDIEDISNPREVYHGAQTDFWIGLVFHQYVVLQGSVKSPGLDTMYYGLMDLADPAHPIDLGLLPSDAWLWNIVSDSVATGDFITHGMSVLKGGITTGFHSTALLNEGPQPAYGFNGSAPPFFIIMGGLWRLSNQDRR
jgi:hypothetical protein